MDRGVWQGCSPCSHTSVGHDLATKQPASPYLLLFSYLLIDVCVCVCVCMSEAERKNILFQSFKFVCFFFFSSCFHLPGSHAAGRSLAPKKMNSPFCTMQTGV